VQPAYTELGDDVADGVEVEVKDETEVELPVAVEVELPERVLVGDNDTVAVLDGVEEPLAVPVDASEAEIEAVIVWLAVVL
jgi:hypothetical protein